MTSGTGEVHAVIGAGGGIGNAVVHSLLRSGLQVRALARRTLDLPPGVEQRTVDVLDRRATSAALEGASVVYHCAMPAYHRWPQEFPELTRAVADAAESVGAGLVMADNLYSARNDGEPITETDPDRDHGHKARTRTAMRSELLRSPGLRVTFGRAADYYGPGTRGLNSLPGNLLFERGLAGKLMLWPGKLSERHVLHYLPDLADGLVMLGCTEAAWGKSWNIPAPAPLTGEGYAQAVAANARPRLAAVPRWGLVAAGLIDVRAREAAEIFWQFDRRFIIDSSAFENHIGTLQLTAHREAIAETMAWWRQAHQ